MKKAEIDAALADRYGAGLEPLKGQWYRLPSGAVLKVCYGVSKEVGKDGTLRHFHGIPKADFEEFSGANTSVMFVCGSFSSVADVPSGVLGEILSGVAPAKGNWKIELFTHRDSCMIKVAGKPKINISKFYETGSTPQTPSASQVGENTAYNRKAIFARNHDPYLRFAADTAASDPERLVTFRSSKPWSAARRELDRVDPGNVSVYFAVIGGGPRVRFKAQLQEVLLYPETSDAQVQRLLRYVPRGTEEEGVWKDGSGSLYAVSGCYELDEPFPLSKLTKARGGKQLSADFKYSYSVVLDPKAEEPGTIGTAVDTPSPPPKAEARTYRIIRDTALVRRLKRAHDHTCQVCRLRLELRNGQGYSEGHHLHPLGSPHNGPDVEENLLIVCPNCHALLDYCALPLLMEELDLGPSHRVGETYLEYHNELVREADAR